jgi:CspA family cold shock protein
MKTGTVKFFNSERGFGFVTVDNEERDIFVHISNCDEAIDLLRNGDRVQFEDGVSDRSGKPEAKNVTVIEASVTRVGKPASAD